MFHELDNAVDIIYTTDGSEPVIEHAVYYTEPIVISDITTVKARAVRKGTAKTPDTVSATHMSYTQKAYYSRMDIKPADKIADGLELSNGVDYVYYSLPMTEWGKLYMIFITVTVISLAIFCMSDKIVSIFCITLSEKYSSSHCAHFSQGMFLITTI